PAEGTPPRNIGESGQARRFFSGAQAKAVPSGQPVAGSGPRRVSGKGSLNDSGRAMTPSPGGWSLCQNGQGCLTGTVGLTATGLPSFSHDTALSGIACPVDRVLWWG